MKNLYITPSLKPIRKKIIVPGDKSISHRSIMLGSIAKGLTQVSGLLEGEDVLCTISIFKNLGVHITKKKNIWRIEGQGIHTLKSPSKTLYCGNSGTTLRLLTGLFSGLPLKVSMTGDASLNSRPMGRVMEPLQQMGAIIREEKNTKGRFIHIEGHSLSGGTFKLKVSSAQLKSALLLAGLHAQKPVIVSEPIKSRDHSERMFKAFGAKIKTQGLRVTVMPSTSPLKGQKIIVPSDISSAAFFMVLGLIHPHPKTEITILNVGVNPTRTGILDILKKMGGKISLLNRRIVCGEPVADIRVRSSKLKSTSLSKKIIPRLVDEIPILCIAAAFAKGKTKIRGAEELRIKETDRLKAISTEFSKFGIKIQEYPDGLDITGGQPLHAATGESLGDHRIAMSMAILGKVLPGTTLIHDTECIATSFPTFETLIEKLT